MKVNEAPLLPPTVEPALKVALTKMIRELASKLNQLASGAIAGNDNTATSVPTTGTWVQGDFVKNSAPVELGGAGNKYVVQGWTRITSGSGNVLNTDWVAVRTLTGN